MPHDDQGDEHINIDQHAADHRAAVLYIRDAIHWLDDNVDRAVIRNNLIAALHLIDAY